MASRHMLFIMALLLLFGIGSNPRGETIENDFEVCENETATLHCGTAGGSKSTYSWRFASKKLVPQKGDKYEQIQNGAILLVKNVISSDMGYLKYISCQTYSKDFSRIVYLYKIMIECRNIESSVGSSMGLPCKADIPDDEIEYIKWNFIFKKDSKIERLAMVKKDGKITLASSLRFDGRISVQNKTLTIHNIKMKDVGTYQCIAYRKKNIHLSKPTYRYNVNVTAKTTARPSTMETIAMVHKTITPSPSTTSKAKFTTATTGSITTITSILVTQQTKAVLPMTRPSVFATKAKDVLSSIVDIKTSNKTKKLDDVTSNGSTGRMLSSWLLVFLCSQYLMLSILDDRCSTS